MGVAASAFRARGAVGGHLCRETSTQSMAWHMETIAVDQTHVLRGQKESTKESGEADGRPGVGEMQNTSPTQRDSIMQLQLKVIGQECGATLLDPPVL